MTKYLKILSAIALLVLLALGCASRGRPGGGPIDETPPEIVSESPANLTTNFKAKEIRIRFNEYIKVKDLQKQLIISPPMKYQPVITPQGSASKEIRIKILDTLEANATYAFNFGNSIVDNNEENPYEYYRYVFSTGETIDSLTVSGEVFDAESKRADDFVSVMLYEIDSAYTDSIVYKEKPKYITNTLDSLTTFTIENLKEGQYKLVALKEENSNFTFEPKTDKIGFYEGVLTVPTDSFYNITLFKERPDFKVLKPSQVAEQRIQFPYEGDYVDLDITVKSDSLDNLEYRLMFDKQKDTVYYWYKPKVEIDSAEIFVKSKSFEETFKYKFRGGDKDSLVVSLEKPGTLNFNEIPTILGTIPFTKIDTTKINLIDKDSARVTYDVKYESLKNRYKLIYELQESEKYKMQLLPGALTDFYGETNDTLNFNFGTKLKSDYGKIRVRLVNAKLPMIVQLVDDKGNVQYEAYADEYPVVDLNDLQPKQYQLRVIFDTNKNGKFDTGNYLRKTQPERISYYPVDEDTNVRANFDYELTFTLKD